MPNPPHGAAQTALIVWREWSLNQLSEALRECREWEQDRDRHRIGYVRLSCNRHAWIVLVSDDLIRAELPF